MKTEKIKSNAVVENIRPTGKVQKVADGGGLTLLVRASGRKVWQFRYKRGGKHTNIDLGDFPAMDLHAARLAAAQARETLARGGSLIVEKARTEEIQRLSADTFKDLAEAFIKRESARWSDSHLRRFHNRMAHDVFPVIGDLPIDDVKPVDVMRAISAIEARGSQNTALRVVQMIGQVCRFAVARGKREDDPTMHLRGGLDHAPPTKHRLAVIRPAEVGELLADVWDWPGADVAKLIHQIAAYTFQRPGEIRAMRWADLDLDSDEPVWTFHVTKVKVDHAVPLAPQVVEILRSIPRSGKRPHVFASMAVQGFVSDVLPPKFMRQIGWQDRHSCHGWRSTARTLLAERLKYEPRLIEQQLSHSVPETHGRAYNRALHIDDRREMMSAYAAYLDELRFRAAPLHLAAPEAAE